MNAIQSVLSDEQKELFEPIAIELRKGEASFHHPRMIHGSFANTTASSRRATVINVFRDGVKSASNEALLEGVPVIASGEKMRGQFFPLLFDPNAI
jgi:ectoine hydroxylase-related dioxygenase (phytanoyl-CoA dioxygenase family)